MNQFKIHTWLTLLALALLGPDADACLTFSLKDGTQNVYGRNFDWPVGVGAVMVNQRNTRKTAFVLPPEIPISWVSKYGSVTFNQFSKEVPVGGMNEKGLVMECLVSKAEYPLPDRRKTINELQWIQYHLDTCSTVEEVIKSAKRIRISPYVVNLHYFISDGAGQSAVIEFKGGKMVYRSGKSLPKKVLANRDYDNALKTAASKDTRFARCAGMIEQYDKQENTVKYAFEILDAVSQGDFTKWQVVYDITHRQIFFRTLQNRKTKQIALSDFDFEQMTETLMVDVNIEGEGAIRKKFDHYTEKRNNELIRTSLEKFEAAGIMQHIKPEHVEYIKKAVASCKRVRP